MWRRYGLRAGEASRRRFCEPGEGVSIWLEMSLPEINGFLFRSFRIARNWDWETSIQNCFWVWVRGFFQVEKSNEFEVFGPSANGVLQSSSNSCQTWRRRACSSTPTLVQDRTPVSVLVLKKSRIEVRVFAMFNSSEVSP